MKKGVFFTLLAVMIVLSLQALAQQVPSYRPTATSQRQAVMYFRFYRTPYLGREERTIVYDPATSFEKALAQALVAGPSSVYPHLKPLFPPGTEVLAAQGQGEVLFITFNENLMHAYADEQNAYADGYREGEGLLRRELAMASLSLSITENTDYAYVQPLVMGNVSTSLRLSERYYLRASDALADPLARAEQSVLTPSAAAKLLLDAWEKQDTAGMGAYLTGEAPAIKNSPPPLSSFALSQGTVSMDGQTAIVNTTVVVSDPNGGAYHKALWPLRLRMVQGVWLTDAASLAALLETLP